MALTGKQKSEAGEFAKRYVEGNVQCNQPNSRYLISGNTMDSIDDAVDACEQRCGRPAVHPSDVDELRRVLLAALRMELEALECD